MAEKLKKDVGGELQVHYPRNNDVVAVAFPLDQGVHVAGRLAL